MMRRATYPLIALLISSVLITGCTDTTEPMKVSGDPHPVTSTKVLELGWGTSEYRVGYMDEKQKSNYETGLVEYGPSSVYVDNECSIYISDWVNRRLVKYDSDGHLAGEIREFDGGWVATAGIDCIYYLQGRSTLYRYRNDRDILSMDISNLASSYGSLILQADTVGNLFIFLFPKLDRGNVDFVKIDSSFASVGEIKQLPVLADDDPLFGFIDDMGNIFYIGYNQNQERSAYMLDNQNNSSLLFAFNKDQEVSMGPVKQDELFPVRYDRCFYKYDGTLVEKLEISDGGLTSNLNGILFARQLRKRPDNKSQPFRIYKLDIDWNVLNE